MTDSAQSTPEQLIRLLEPIHDEARAMARRLCRSRADGDDLFQESALRAMRKLHTLRDEKSFRWWFYRVLFSVHRNRSRRDTWRRLLRFGRQDEHEVIGADGSEWEEERQRVGRMAEALARLPAVQREAIVLCDIHEMSVEEIAALQGASASAVKSRLSRGRRRLRAYYERIGMAPLGSRLDPMDVAASTAPEQTREVL